MASYIIRFSSKSSATLVSITGKIEYKEYAHSGVRITLTISTGRYAQLTIIVTRKYSGTLCMQPSNFNYFGTNDYNIINTYPSTPLPLKRF